MKKIFLTILMLVRIPSSFATESPLPQKWFGSWTGPDENGNISFMYLKIELSQVTPTTSTSPIELGCSALMMDAATFILEGSIDFLGKTGKFETLSKLNGLCILDNHSTKHLELIGRSSMDEALPFKGSLADVPNGTETVPKIVGYFYGGRVTLYPIK